MTKILSIERSHDIGVEYKMWECTIFYVDLYRLTRMKVEYSTLRNKRHLSGYGERLEIGQIK